MLESALNVIGDEPRLEEPKQRVEALLTEARTGLARQEAARQTALDRDRFLRHRDDVLFYSSEFTGLDRPENLAKAAAAAKEGLKLFGLSDGPAVVKDNANLDDTEKQQVLDGAAGLFLILVRTALQSDDPASKSERRETLWPCSTAVSACVPPAPPSTPRGPDFLAALGDKEGADRERKLADQLKEDVRTHKRNADATDSFLLGLQQFERGDLDGAATRFLSTLREQPNHFWRSSISPSATCAPGSRPRLRLGSIHVSPCAATSSGAISCAATPSARSRTASASPRAAAGRGLLRRRGKRLRQSAEDETERRRDVRPARQPRRDALLRPEQQGSHRGSAGSHSPEAGSLPGL